MKDFGDIFDRVDKFLPVVVKVRLAAGDECGGGEIEVREDQLRDFKQTHCQGRVEADIMGEDGFDEVLCFRVCETFEGNKFAGTAQYTLLVLSCGQ